MSRRLRSGRRPRGAGRSRVCQPLSACLWSGGAPAGAVDTFSTPLQRAGGVPGGRQMPYYESVLIARQEIGGGDAERLGEHYEEVLGKEGASVVRREYWGLRRLAYQVRKNRKGHYLMFHVDGPGSAIQEFERQLRIDENVVRYLTMRLDQLPDGPSIIMKARAEREERRDQGGTRRDVERPPADAADGGGAAPESKAGGEAGAPAEAERVPDAGAADSAPGGTENEAGTDDAAAGEDE